MTDLTKLHKTGRPNSFLWDITCHWRRRQQMSDWQWPTLNC